MHLFTLVAKNNRETLKKHTTFTYLMLKGMGTHLMKFIWLKRKQLSVSPQFHYHEDNRTDGCPLVSADPAAPYL